MTKLSCFTGGIASTNGWVLQSESAIIVADAPEGMTAWLEKQGLVPSALLLTHQHFDHVQDAAAMKAKFGCPIYAFAPYSRELTLELMYAAMTGSGFSVPPFEVDHVLKGQGSLALGGWQWELMHIPGHSTDSLCFRSAAEGIVIGGDVLFAGSIGRTDFPGGSLEQLLSGIARHLLPLSDATRVLPGHGPETSIGEERLENPYLE
jgi:hydroxyacylglutathione hydrolase